MQPSLVVAEGRQQGQRVSLSISPFVIGRDQTCQLRPHSDEVAPRHCALVQRDGRLFVRDLGSGQGTFVNYERIEGEVLLDEGDRLQVGPLAFLVSLTAAAAEPAEAPAPAAAAPPTAMPATQHDSLSSGFDSQELVPLGGRDLAATPPPAAAYHFLIRDTEEGVTVATFTDERIIDELTIREIKAELARLVAEGRLKVLLDFQNVKHLSSAAIGTIIGFHKEIRAAGGRVRICSVNANVSDVFRMMGMEKLIQTFPDEEAAMLRRW